MGLEAKRWSDYCFGCQIVYEECEESVFDGDSDDETEEDDIGEDRSGSGEYDGYEEDEYEDYEWDEYEESDSESDGWVDSHDADIPEPLSKEELTIMNECKICFSQHCDVLLLPCAHLVLCEVLYHFVFCVTFSGVRRKRIPNWGSNRSVIGA
jgi:hypothetical protein